MDRSYEAMPRTGICTVDIGGSDAIENFATASRTRRRPMAPEKAKPVKTYMCMYDGFESEEETAVNMYSTVKWLSANKDKL